MWAKHELIFRKSLKLQSKSVDLLFSSQNLIVQPKENPEAKVDFAESFLGERGQYCLSSLPLHTFFLWPSLPNAGAVLGGRTLTSQSSSQLGETEELSLM